MAGELRATVLTTVKGDAVKKLQKDLGGLSDSLKGIGGVVGKVAKGFAGFASAIGATKFITSSIEQAKLLEQTYRSLETVFGPVAGQMEEFAKSATKIGLSQTEAAKASIFIGNVLQQYGISTQDAADKTKKLVGLAADLAFVTGYDVQEALLGMTALFRGEYDPIEKFGVAMKQNEIESIKAARGLAGLTGQAELHADVLIREELLLQRTAKSMGAFTENSDTLAVQTEVMRATFENLQATIGMELTPVITQFYSDLIPIIEEAGPSLVKIIDLVVVVIKELARTFLDIFDPTTELGESVAGLIVQFDELGKTIFGKDFAFIGGVFDVARYLLDLFIRALTDLLYMIQSVIIEFQAWGILIKAVFEQDWDTVAKGIQGISKELHAAKDAAIAAGNAMAKFAQAEEVASGFSSLPDVWNLVGSGAKDAGNKTGLDFGKSLVDGTKQGAKDPIKEFWSGLTDDIAKQSAKMKLTSMGASEGLIGAILGSGSDWKKVFDNIIKAGSAGIKKAQSLFNRTADGIKEIEESAKKAAEEIQRLADEQVKAARKAADATEDFLEKAYWNSYADAIESGLDTASAALAAQTAKAQAAYDANLELIRQQRELRKAFEETAASIFETFGQVGVEENLGTFATGVKNLREELIALIEANKFDAGEGIGLFKEKAQQRLIESITKITEVMQTVASARDKVIEDIANAEDTLRAQQEGRKSVFESIVDSIMGNVNVAQIGGKATNILKSLRRTLDQTKTFSDQIKQLREAGLNSTAIKQIIDAGAQVGGSTAKGIMSGGPEAINEINKLYTEIGAVAADIGEQGAGALFDAGISASQSLIDGLLSEQEALVAAANYLAEEFQKAFEKATNKARVKIATQTVDQMLGLDPSVTPNFNPIYSSGSGRFTININPGLVTDPVGLGREVVSAIQRYESTNGQVFERSRRAG